VKNFYSAALQNLKEKNLYRELVESDAVASTVVLRGDKKFISFCSNDYLGLAHHASVKEAAIDAIKKFGVGAGASRYITGNNSLYGKLEKALAKFKKTDAAIVFSSGYATAIGVIPALVGEGDLIVADRLIHSSLIDGSKLSGARLIRFLHNDVAHTKKILAENRSKFKKCLIVTETVFSMDGDVGEVKELLELAEKFNAILISDAAHDLFLDCNFATGPRHEDGVTTRENCHPVFMTGSSNYLQLGTFSKAFGSLGGYVAGEKILIDYLRNFAKSQIYSTALPPAILAASLTSLKIISKKNLGKKALANAEYFCELMNLPKPQSAIVVIILGENKKTLDVAAQVAARGFLISAIRPPTVEVGKARLRITFSAAHKKNQIKKLAEILSFSLREIYRK
jgi:8-amino-7-oxononanoate synthase